MIVNPPHINIQIFWLCNKSLLLFNVISLEEKLKWTIKNSSNIIKAGIC